MSTNKDIAWAARRFVWALDSGSEDEAVVRLVTLRETVRKPTRTPKDPRPRLAQVARRQRWSDMSVGGMTYREIAEAEGVKIDSIKYAFRKYELPHGDQRGRVGRARGAAMPERDEEIRRLAVDEHLSFTDIGARMGITRERVRQVLHKRFDINLYDLHHERLAREAAVRTKPCKTCGEPILVGKQRAHHLAEHRMRPEWLARDAAIVVDYQAGMLTDDIMVKHHTSGSAISRALKRHGVPFRRHDKTVYMPTLAESDARKDRIVERLLAGEGVSDIAAAENCSDTWVDMTRRKRGIPSAAQIRWKRWQGRFDAGLSYRTIGEAEGVPHQTVRNAIRTMARRKHDAARPTATETTDTKASMAAEAARP